MDQEPSSFTTLSTIERWFNRLFGALVGLGIGFAHSYVLEVRGRKSGKLHTTPVDLLVQGEKRFLVAPRGLTQWVRNAESAGEITLRKGSRTERYRVRPLADSEKPPILKAYLDSFRREVQRFFPIPAGSPEASFAALAPRYPAFELTPVA